ncbi:ParB/RepB/Spo0J family partition protein [Sandarakinorhabdus rubra]|uniref:ParB/RepB/Spo0J family partition protein n=1 Tax=Sandarakinorhabdus rubra TaxID=2672568 RepID=UPI0013D9B5D6|nr:ParB/RepB/Spo0J family partition protein [Sandarakinorhabdus rubra]
MTDSKRKSGLGRGLSALLEDIAAPPPVNAPGVVQLPVADIMPNPAQPRRNFDDDAMAELVTSVRAHGILQPILVRPHGGRHQIIAGERRWRAAQSAGLHEMPVVVRQLDEREVAEIALIENVQRADLNAIEEARGYQRLIGEFGHTQAALAQIVGKSRSHLTNLLRLLDLPPKVQALVEAGSLSMGHARALVGAEDAEALAAKAVAGGLSVRALEQLVAGQRPPSRAGRTSAPAAAATGPSDPNSEALEEQLAEALGMPVALTIAAGASSGSLTIRFADLDQLDLLCARLGVG